MATIAPFFGYSAMITRSKRLPIPGSLPPCQDRKTLRTGASRCSRKTCDIGLMLAVVQSRCNWTTTWALKNRRENDNWRSHTTHGDEIEQERGPEHLNRTLRCRLEGWIGRGWGGEGSLNNSTTIDTHGNRTLDSATEMLQRAHPSNGRPWQ